MVVQLASKVPQNYVTQKQSNITNKYSEGSTIAGHGRWVVSDI